VQLQSSGLKAHEGSGLRAQGTSEVRLHCPGHSRGMGSIFRAHQGPGVGGRGQWSVVREPEGSWVEARIRSVFSALSSAPRMEVEGSSRKVEVMLSDTGYLNTHGARKVR